MALREKLLAEPIVITHDREQLVTVSLEETADGPVFKAGWLVPEADGTARLHTRRVPAETADEIMANPSMVALLDMIAEATRTIAE